MISFSELKNKQVIDSDGKHLGKIDDISINEETGEIEMIELKKSMFMSSKDKQKITFKDIDLINDVILLNKKMKEDGD